MLLEDKVHEASTFLTLTYEDEALDAFGWELNFDHLQTYLKDIRAHFHPTKLRFYGVGEYGDEGGRPHFHIMLYGTGMEAEGDYQDKWPFGFTYAGDVTHKSAGYIVGYIKDKLTDEDGERLEEARMSLKPGIGAGPHNSAIEFLYNIVKDWDYELPVTHIFLGGKQQPLGSYIGDKLALRMGFSQEQITAAKNAWQAEINDERGYVAQVINVDHAKATSMVKRHQIFTRRKTI